MKKTEMKRWNTIKICEWKEAGNKTQLSGINLHEKGYKKSIQVNSKS